MQEVAKVLENSYPQKQINQANSVSASDSVAVSASNKNLSGTNTNTKTLREVRRIAWTLCEKLNNRSRYRLYCKYAWRLPEGKLWNNLEIAQDAQRDYQKQGKPCDINKIFTWLCEQELQS